MNNYIDSHHHITVELPIISMYNTFDEKGIREQERVNCLHRSIGIHPLHINKELNRDYIESLIIKDKNLNIGEIGLDKRGDNILSQIETFNFFLDLSKKHERSISVHCVKKWGLIIDSIKSKYDRDMPHLYHGFSGSMETLRIVSDGNSFFSFSLKDLTREKLISIIECIPIERLLIESDMTTEDYLKFGTKSYLQTIESTYKEIANIKGVPIITFTNLLKQNFIRFLNDKEIL